jgi:hypothetical protein
MRMGEQPVDDAIEGGAGPALEPTSTTYGLHTVHDIRSRRAHDLCKRQEEGRVFFEVYVDQETRSPRTCESPVISAR